MNERDRIRWATTLCTTGWLFLLAYCSYLVTQIRRAAAISSGSFEDGVWGQRIEQISFATLPQNLVVVIPGVVAAVAATLLVRRLVDPVVVRLQRLVRALAALAMATVGISVVGAVAVLFRDFDEIGDTAAILGRLGGTAIGVAAVRLCLDADRDL